MTGALLSKDHLEGAMTGAAGAVIGENFGKLYAKNNKGALADPETRDQALRNGTLNAFHLTITSKR